MPNASQTLQTDLYNIASNHDGILDMIVYGFVNDMSPSQVRYYQDMLNTNFPNQVTKVTQTKVNVSALYDIKTEKDTSDDGIKSLNFR
tara:strand:- start:1622 stop:1885 length:264 start_codon:yes stop_codon:yes gene_type:complete